MTARAMTPRVIVQAGSAARASVIVVAAAPRVTVRAQTAPLASQAQAPAVAVTVSQPGVSLGVAGVQGPPASISDQPGNALVQDAAGALFVPALPKLETEGW